MTAHKKIGLLVTADDHDDRGIPERCSHSRATNEGCEGCNSLGSETLCKNVGKHCWLANDCILFQFVSHKVPDFGEFGLYIHNNKMFMFCLFVFLQLVLVSAYLLAKLLFLTVAFFFDSLGHFKPAVFPLALLILTL